MNDLFIKLLYKLLSTAQYRSPSVDSTNTHKHILCFYQNSALYDYGYGYVIKQICATPALMSIGLGCKHVLVP